MERKHLVIGLIIVLVLVSYYYFVPDNSGKLSSLVVVDVLDGDTVILENDMRVRLKGINAPETGMLHAKEAKQLLEKATLGKSVKIKHYGQDRYGRLLAYLFVDGENVNQMLVKSGLAHSYYYEEDDYYDEIIKAENQARAKRLGLWRKSSNSGCIKIIELDYFDKGDDNETLTILNVCGEDIDVTIKDDATHIYKRSIEEGVYVEQFQNIFNDNGDSIYIWDEEGLVDFWRY